MQRWGCWFTLTWGIAASFMKKPLRAVLPVVRLTFLLPPLALSFLTITRLFKAALIFCLIWCFRFVGRYSTGLCLQGEKWKFGFLARFSSVPLFWDKGLSEALQPSQQVSARVVLFISSDCSELSLNSGRSSLGHCLVDLSAGTLAVNWTSSNSPAISIGALWKWYLSHLLKS